MDSLRTLIKKKSSPIAVRALRSTMKKWIKKVVHERWKGAWIAPDMRVRSESEAHQCVKDADLVIFNIHGGGFRVGHCTMYIDTFIIWLSLLKKKHNVNAVIMSVDYGLAPKHKYPRPVLECVEAYTYLRHELDVPANKIVMTGDSAGGALCLETLVRVCAPSMLVGEKPDLPLYERPAGLVLVSPLVTPESSSASWKQFGKTDLVGHRLKKIILKEYLDLPRTRPDDLPILQLSKHLRDSFERFLSNNVLVFVGDKEVMRDDIHQLESAVRARVSSINIKLVRENYAHDWYLVREIIKPKDRPMLAKYDELFADFATRAVQTFASSSSTLCTQSFSPDKQKKGNGCTIK